MGWHKDDRGAGRRGYHHGNLREALIRAALELIAEKGPAGFTFADAALGQILGGKEQEPTTVFNIYGSTIAKEYDTIYAPIEFEWDLGARTGRVRIPNTMEASLQPIRNPVTGKPHRALIKLPEGFEYREAEMASSTVKSSGDIALDQNGVYGAMWYAAYGPYGIIDLR